MAGTIARLVRKAVVDGLANEPALQGVSVTYGWDARAIARYMIFTARPSAETPPSGLRSGRNVREETADFRVVVLVQEPGTDAYGAESKLDEIAPIVEDFLADRKNNELGVPGLNWIRVTGWEGDDGRAEDGYVAQRTYTIRYQARIE